MEAVAAVLVAPVVLVVAVVMLMQLAAAAVRQEARPKISTRTCASSIKSAMGMMTHESSSSPLATPAPTPAPTLARRKTED